MDLLNRFQAIIREKQLFAPVDHLLLAVSGGVDSVALCELCHRSGYTFTILHCNFTLRGEESERDERFVRELAARYGVNAEVKRFDTETYARDHKVSIQEAARELRYGWFAEMVGSSESGVLSRESVENSTETMNSEPKTTKFFLLTAHHADDNVETLMMHFFRGTGLHGLTGMPERSGHIRRPLLGFFKEELVDWATEQQLGWMEDTSNLSSKYTRNYFRNELLPAIGKVYPKVKENLLDNIGRLGDAEQLYRMSVERLKKKLCRARGVETHIPVRLLASYQNTALVFELLREFGFTEGQAREVPKLYTSGSGHYILSADNTHRLLRHRDWLVVSSTIAEGPGLMVLEASGMEGGPLELYPGSMIASGKPVKKLIVSLRQGPAGAIPSSPLEAWLDARDIEFPLILRLWKPGDYFYPLGMKKKKKLARFLIDQKLSLSDKEKVWVLESGRRILWVAGYRIDERFRVTETTGQLLCLRLETD